MRKHRCSNSNCLFCVFVREEGNCLLKSLHLNFHIITDHNKANCYWMNTVLLSSSLLECEHFLIGMYQRLEHNWSRTEVFHSNIYSVGILWRWKKSEQESEWRPRHQQYTESIACVVQRDCWMESTTLTMLRVGFESVTANPNRGFGMRACVCVWAQAWFCSVACTTAG